MGNAVTLDIQNLTMRFGGFTAVDDVSFKVKKGEVVGFLGPNGAGKTTTMRMITGSFIPSGGGAQICGYDIQTDRLAAQGCLGYLPEGAPLYGDMTPRMMFDFIAEARNMPLDKVKAQAAFLIETLGLSPVFDQMIETLSKGYKRRVGLACALLHDPEVLILDEPTDGLDPNQKFDVRRLIKTMAHDQCKTILISTHILEEVDAVCDRIILMHQGRIIAEGVPKDLLKAHKNYKTLDDFFRGLTANTLQEAA